MGCTETAFSLEGKTAIVTGGASGLGLAITRCMSRSGARVIALGSRDDASGKAALADMPGETFYYQYDVTDTDRAQALVDSLTARHGAITTLVNNAGNHCKKPIEEMTVAEFTDVLEVHLVGSFALTKALIPHMKANGSGSVIFQASMTSFIGQPNVLGYSAAKAGMLGMVRTLASECGASGVRVNAIAPGWIDTPMFRKATDNDAPRLAKILGRIPMNRTGLPEDIGLAAVFLASDAARYISGVCLPVDGGALIGF
jgi:Dehydrogenases with different specificities (related to short-chain alcohol dehydrogenases)